MTYKTNEIAKKARVHYSVDAIVEMIEECSDEYLGLCIECGEIAEGVEPDARGYQCECCSRPAVFGMEEIGLCVI